MNVANGNSSTPATAATDASSSPDQQHTHVSTNGQRNSSSSRTSVGGVQQPGQQQQQQQFYSPYYPMQTNGAMGAGMPPQQQQGYIPQQAQQQRPPTHHQKPPRPSTSNNTATSDSTSSSGANTRRESQVAGASGGGNGRSSVVSTSTTSSNLPSTSAPVFTPAAHNQQQQLYQQHQTPSHPHHQPAHMMHPQFGYPTPPPHMLPQHFMQHHPQQYGGSGGVPPHYGGGDVYGGYYAGGQPYGYPTMGHPPPSTTAGGGGAPIRIGGGVSMPPPSSSSAASNTIVSSSASTASSVGPSPSSTPTSIHAPRLSTTLSNSSSSSISSSLVIPATPSKAIRIVNPLTNKEVKIDSPASIKKSSTNASVENLPSLVVGGGSSSSSASVTTSARASVVSVAELVPAAPSTATTAATSRTSIATTGVTVAAIAAAIPVSVSAQTPTTPSSTTISTASPANVVVPKKSTAIVFRDPVTGEVMNFSKSKVKIVDPKTLEEVVNKSTASTGAPVEVKPAVVVKPSVAPSPAAAAQVSVASAAAAVVPPASSPAVSSAVTSSAAPTTAVPAVSSKPVAAAIAPTTTATKSTTSTPAEKPLQVSTSSLQTSASNSSSSDINVVEPILKSSPRSVSPNKIGMKRSASPAKDLAIDTKPSSAGSPVSVEKPKTASLVSAAPSTAAAVALSAVPKDRAFTVISSNEGFKYPEGIPAPVINQGVQAPSYSKLFLMAMKDKVMVKPAGLVDVASLIEADAMSSPRTGGGPKSARGGSMSSGGSGRGHPFGGMGFGGNNNSGGNRGGPPMQHQGSGRGGVPLGSKSSRNSAPRRQPSRGDSRDFGSGRNESSRGGRYSTNQNQVVDNTPFEPIVVSENAWRPKVGSSNSKPVVDESSIEVAIGKECTAILNKLTPERFEPLSDQILNLPIENEELLRIIINKIFDKALFEAFYARQYALLCSKLSDKLPHLQKWISIDAKNNAFRRALLNKCQEEFESGTTWAAADLAAREQAKLVNEMTQEEKDTFLVEQESRNKAKIRTLGNMRFIGELFIAGLITEKIMHSCVVQLISNNVKDPEEEAIESLCKLLMTVGKKLDSAQAARHLDAYFNQISEFSTNLKLQSRIRFMLKDLIEMRANNWKARIQNAGPKTLAEIHKDIQKAAEQKEQGGGRGGRNSTSGRRDMPNLHDQFGGGRNGSSRGGRGSRDNRLPTSDGWTSVGGGGTSMKSSASQSSKPDMTEFGKIGSGGNSKVLGPNYGNGKGFSGGSKGWQQQQQGGSASNSFVAAKESVKSGEGSSNMFG